MSTIDKVLILLVVLVFGACKKIELPPPVEEDPVFAVSATLDGAPLNLVAGDEGYYLYTSFAKDDLEVYSFSGRFAELEDCGDVCKETLEFEIRDVTTNVVSAPNIEEALAIKSYPYVGTMMEADTVLSGYEVTFENRSISNLQMSYFWEFSNGDSTTQETPDPRFYPASPNMNFSVRMEATGVDNNSFCYQVVNKNINFQQSSLPDCQLDFNLDPDSLLSDVCALMTGVPPYFFEWMVDSLMFGECINLAGTISDTVNIQLSGMDSAGCTDSINISLSNILNPNGASIGYCSADFDYQAIPQYEVIQPSDSLFLSHVIIRYTSPDGVSYSTTNQSQPSESNFQILASSAYLDNENGEQTRQLKIRFSAVLYGENNEELLLQNGEAIIAVAHP